MGNAIASPGIWAEVGGLNGLVIFALFAVLWAFARTLQTILNNHRTDLSSLMSLHAKEREEWGRIVDERQKDTNLAIKAMAEALNKMSMRKCEHDLGLGDK